VDLKIGTIHDIDDVETLTRAFISEYKIPVTYNREVLLKNFRASEGSPDTVVILLRKNEKVIGFLVGFANSPLFSTDKIATEAAWYVYPEHRGRGSLKLLQAYEYWAKHVAKCKLIQMLHLGDERLDKLYERKGYRKSEVCYIKEI
jgi:GNAT superfamily N-acetyltransferase